MLSAYYVLDSIWDMARLGVHKIFFLRVFSVKGDQQVSQQWPNGVRDVLSELWIFAPGSLQEKLTQPGSSISVEGQLTLTISR